MAGYREASELAHRLFDSVVYGHEVEATDEPLSFRVSYSDELTMGGETLRHMAEQHVTMARTPVWSG